MKCFSYTKSTKAVLATAVLSSFSLGILMFLTHFVSFVKIDYVLKWLLPLCLALLVFSIIFIIITLSVAGGTLQEDILELRYFSTLFDIAYANGIISNRTYINKILFIYLIYF